MDEEQLKLIIRDHTNSILSNLNKIDVGENTCSMQLNILVHLIKFFLVDNYNREHHKKILEKIFETINIYLDNTYILQDRNG